MLIYYEDGTGGISLSPAFQGQIPDTFALGLIADRTQC